MRTVDMVAGMSTWKLRLQDDGSVELLKQSQDGLQWSNGGHYGTLDEFYTAMEEVGMLHQAMRALK